MRCNETEVLDGAQGLAASVVVTQTAAARCCILWVCGACAGTAADRRHRRRLPPSVRRVLSLAFLLTTLLAAAFGGDDFFLASPETSAHPAGLRPGAFAGSNDRRSMCGIVRMRRRTAAGCWQRFQHMASAALTAGVQTSRRAMTELRRGSAVAHSQLLLALDAWPGVRQAGTAQLATAGNRLRDAGGQFRQAAQRDLFWLAAAAQASAVAASGETRRLVADPALYAASRGRCCSLSTTLVMTVSSSSNFTPAQPTLCSGSIDCDSGMRVQACKRRHVQCLSIDEELLRPTGAARSLVTTGGSSGQDSCRQVELCLPNMSIARS